MFMRKYSFLARCALVSFFFFLFLFFFVFCFFFFFFFQAEDGIRDGRVTGVQTCALPISRLPRRRHGGGRADPGDGALGLSHARDQRPARAHALWCRRAKPAYLWPRTRRCLRSRPCRGGRSEERRVGKEGRTRGGTDDGRE